MTLFYRALPGVLAGILAAASAIMPSASASEITVMRGAERMAVDTAHKGRTPVVLRGEAAMPGRSGAPTMTPTVVLFQPAIVAGDTLWYLAGNRLAACSFGYGTQVGERVIRCTKR